MVREAIDIGPVYSLIARSPIKRTVRTKKKRKKTARTRGPGSAMPVWDGSGGGAYAGHAAAAVTVVSIKSLHGIVNVNVSPGIH